MTWGTHYMRARTAHPMCALLNADRAYEAHMQQGSDKLLHAIWREMRRSQDHRGRQL